MKKVFVIVGAAALAVAGCGSNSSPTTPTNQPTIFTVQLSPANEVPPITNAESTARGTAVITFNTVKDSAGNITSATADFNVSMTGFPATTTNLSAAHIHNGPAGVSAGVFVSTNLAAANAPISNGSGTFTATGISLTADQATQILNNPAGFYFNVHTPTNPGGVMRGQLR